MNTDNVLIFTPSIQYASLIGREHKPASGFREVCSISGLLNANLFGATREDRTSLLIVASIRPDLEITTLLTFITKHRPDLDIWLVARTSLELQTLMAFCKGCYKRAFTAEQLPRALDTFIKSQIASEGPTSIQHPSAA